MAIDALKNALAIPPEMIKSFQDQQASIQTVKEIAERAKSLGVDTKDVDALTGIADKFLADMIKRFGPKAT